MDQGPFKLFASAKFLCDWVDEEITLLENAISSYVSSDPYLTRHDWDELDRCWYIKIFEKISLPNATRGHASNIVKNLRHALDQAVTAATIALTNKVRKDVYFPLLEEKYDLEQYLASKKCKIPFSIHRTILDLEPYYDGCRGQLVDLGLVSGQHKHTQSLNLLPVIETVEMGHAMAEGSYISYKKPIFHRSGGQVMMAYYTELEQPIQLATYIAFEADILIHAGALNYIYTWSKMVREVVLEIEAKVILQTVK